MKTAILINGGFYRKRAKRLWGKKTSDARVEELIRYTFKHLDEKDGNQVRELYRIFYYDCPPIEKVVYHPLLKKNIEFSKRETYQWTLDFFNRLKAKRKVALRLGRLSHTRAHFELCPKKVKQLCSKKISIDDLQEDDFKISFTQKGVDIKMGVDISSLANDGVVNQIILISGDSDFVPAAKAARRKGIDFILDPMGNDISADLFEHIDGRKSYVNSDPAGRKSNTKSQKKK